MFAEDCKKQDSDIQKDVDTELAWDPRVSSSHIGVSAKNGIVTLTGSVPHFYEKSLAEAAAQRIGGVRAVADEIQVKIMGSYERTDSEIAEAALSALRWNYSVPDGMKVVVEKGWITLRGEVDWDYERNAAKNSVGQLMGVVGVTNDIALKPKIQASDVKTRIEDALKRAAELDGKKISVEVRGDKVVLSGKVGSYAEIDEARLAAWNAPGVMSVENNVSLQQ